jgi:hypothetical protein
LFYLQSYNDFSLLYDKLIALLHLIDKAYAYNQADSSSSIEECDSNIEKEISLLSEFKLSDSNISELSLSQLYSQKLQINQLLSNLSCFIYSKQ